MQADRVTDEISGALVVNNQLEQAGIGCSESVRIALLQVIGACRPFGQGAAPVADNFTDLAEYNTGRQDG